MHIEHLKRVFNETRIDKMGKSVRSTVRLMRLIVCVFGSFEYEAAIICDWLKKALQAKLYAVCMALIRPSSFFNTSSIYKEKPFTNNNQPQSNAKKSCEKSQKYQAAAKCEL